MSGEQNYVVVDILDLNVDHLELGKPKPNKHGGKTIPLKYQGKRLYVKYPKHTAPFGASTNNQKETKGYPETGKVTGYNVSFSMGKDYESNPVFTKLQEVDEWFIEQSVKNSYSWGIGGSKTKPIDETSVRGYDDYGDQGKWKRLVKWSYKKNSDNEKEYSDYPPNYDIGLPATITEYKENEDDKYFEQYAKFSTKFFDAEGKPIKNVVAGTVPESFEGDYNELNTVFRKFSDGSALATWSNLTQGTYGVTMKPKFKQLRIYPSEDIPDDECLLDEDSDEEGDGPGDALGDDVEVEVVATAEAEAEAEAEEETVEVVEEDEGEEVEVVYEEEEEPEPEPEPEPVKPKRVVRKRVVKKN